MKVLQFPLAKISFGFITGILVSYYFKPDIQFVFILLFIAVSAFLFSFLFSKKKDANLLIFGLFTYFLAFSIGAITLIVHTETNQLKHYTQNKAIFINDHFISITIREKLRSTDKNNRYIVGINQIDDSLKTGKLLLNVRKDSLSHKLEIGTQLYLRARLFPNSPAKNPNQFDYSRYLENKQIYAQIYTHISDIKISTNIKKDLWYYTSKWRNTIISNLEKAHFNKEELSVAIALILGQQQEIATEIIKDYQFAGAVHILSVSGLHIGFILMFVTYLLKPFPNTAGGGICKLVIQLGALFSFGFMAGFAPSVLRSVTMFSFVAFGMYFRRSTNIFHTLIVSMLIILLFQPFFLFDVGFQLSYLALFFILWLQPVLVQIWTPKNKLSIYFWQILTVSFAAQIGTLPLSLYYFHQFPGLFFVTNLVIIPFLSLIMGLGVLVMVLAAFDFISLFLSKSLEWCIYFLNQIIAFIASLEQFIFQEIPFNWLMLLSSYLLITTSIIWFKKSSFNRIALALISILFFQIAYFQTRWSLSTQNELIVFNSNRNTLIVERNGKYGTVYAHESVLKNANKNQMLISYSMGNFSDLNGKKRIQNLLFFNGNKILILDSLGLYPKNIRPDIVILTHSPKINFERFLQLTKPKIVVADATNYRNYQKMWKATCQKAKIPFHATAEKGFYRLK